MKIAFFADGPWAHIALDKIKTRHELRMIIARNENPDPVLQAAAEDMNIPFIYPKNINSNENTELLKSIEADLFVSMSFNQILKKKNNTNPPKGNHQLSCRKTTIL